ncbi:MAG: cell division protein FtsZ [Aestuariivita sp.]|nr:cell division protein FtsZ [Aestuariivita sp.]
MTLNLTIPKTEDLSPRIVVFGVGGAGGNAINNMIIKSLEGVEFVSANTDAQALRQSLASSTIQLGINATEGLGAGAKAAVGAKAAEESIEQIIEHLTGYHMCFITAGMGGGTGTGAAPIIAQAARELGVLTVGVVTKPFGFEGSSRMRQAEVGAAALQEVADTLIIIPNQNLFRIANEKTTMTEAFGMADDVLYQGVKGVTDLMVRPGLINLDFADIRSVMDEMGNAMMGTGEAEGEDRAVQAANRAIANPLLDEVSLKGAKGILINVTGSELLRLYEIDEVTNRIKSEVDPDANIIFGSTIDKTMEDKLRVSVVATGIEMEENMSSGSVPGSLESVTEQISAVEEPSIFDTVSSRFDEPTERLNQLEQSAWHNDIATRSSDTVSDGYARKTEDMVSSSRQDEVESPSFSVASKETVEFPVSSTRNDRKFTTQNSDHLNTIEEQSLKAVAGFADQGQTKINKRIEKRGFGINSLINRMTGQSSEPVISEQKKEPRSVRNNFLPDFIDNQDPISDDNQGHVEVPAFMRRQAN